MVSILVVSIGHLQVLLYWHDVYRSNNVVIVIFMLINFVIIKTQVRFHQANLTTGEFCLFYICPYLVIFYYQSRFKDWSVCSLCRLIYKSVLDTQNYSVTLSLQFQQFVYTTAGRLLILRIESDQKKMVLYTTTLLFFSLKMNQDNQRLKFPRAKLNIGRFVNTFHVFFAHQ